MKKNNIVKSPHAFKSASKVLSKQRGSSFHKNKVSEVSELKVNKFRHGLQSKGSSSLLYDEDYMNEIFLNDEEALQKRSTTAMADPKQNIDINDVWGNSFQSKQGKRAFDYHD